MGAVLLGANSVESDRTEPRLDDATGGLCLDLVVCSSGRSMPGCTAPSDAVLAPGFLAIVDPGIAGFPWLAIPAYQLGVGMLVGCNHGQAAAGGDGHGRPGHPTSHPG
jgi:hypothetical protein